MAPCGWGNARPRYFLQGADGLARWRSGGWTAGVSACLEISGLAFVKVIAFVKSVEFGIKIILPSACSVV
jgi:hypothetical protein